MPYKSIDELPETFNNLPPAAKRIAMAAYNAMDDGDEESKIKRAWGAVKKKYKQVDGKWELKESMEDNVEGLEDAPVSVVVNTPPVDVESLAETISEKVIKKSEETVEESTVFSSVPVKVESGNLRESVRLLEAKSDGLSWDVVLIEEGLSKNRNRYARSVLESAVPLFENVKAYADHPTKSEMVERPERSVKDIVGWYTNPKVVALANGKMGVGATMHVLQSQRWFADSLKESYERGNPNLIQLSINASGERESKVESGMMVREVTKLNRIHSVDAVTEASAGGAILASDNNEGEDLMALESITKQDLEALLESRPELRDALAQSTQENTESKIEETVDEGEQNMKETNMEESVLESLRQELAKTQVQIRAMGNKEMVDRIVDESDLPDVAKSIVRESFSDKLEGDITSEMVSESVSKQKTLVEALMGKESRPSSADWVRVDDSPFDQKEKALEGMLEGQAVDGVKPYISFRQAYSSIANKKGDVFSIRPEEIILQSWHYAPKDSGLRESADIDSGTWSVALGNTLHRMLLRRYNDNTLGEWRKIVSRVTNVPDFKIQQRFRVGGFDALPIVNEADDYTNLTPSGEESVTYSVSKRGGLASISMETIANDDIGKVAQIPADLARKAAIGLYRAVFDVIDDNPTMPYDTTTLFHANHGNLGSSALSYSSLSAAKVAIWGQTAFGDDEDFLQLNPKYLLLPSQLYPTAQALMTSQIADLRFEGSPVNTDSGEANIHRNSMEIIRVPYWTDANNWAIVCDPNEMDTVEVGFYQGRQVPELFTQDMGDVGSVFNADKVTYKIRFIFGVAPLDHRSMFKAVVA